MYNYEVFVKVGGCIYLPGSCKHAGFRYLPASQECVLYEYGGTAIFLKKTAINSKLLLL